MHVAAALVVAIAGGVALPGGPTSPEAHAAAPLTPDDPGRAPGGSGWARLQWNFAGRHGVDAPHAWGNLIAAGAPGGRGVTVAVLDTGVAYAGDGLASHASPDLDPARVVAGYDFVDDDATPLDENGHGTHVASTIAEQTDNGYALTGLAYGARIMPVRVLDRRGNGDAVTIARGIRYAVAHGAKVINLSLNFDMRVRQREVPEIVAAIDDAYRRGTLVVAGAGNRGRASLSYPARAAHVLAVGATTQHGCLARYSNHGPDLDLTAPGGGSDAGVPGDAACRAGRPGLPIYQVTFDRRRGGFAITGYIGTSMAAPHVAAAAALVVASGVIGRDPSPDAITARLERTARDAGPAGRDPYYGWGTVDAASATARGPARRPHGDANELPGGHEHAHR